ncbi:MAG: aminotransferase class V-fold PLP-dependent enzyme [Deltaproteobacteria bacterium]|nr:aminotransferase class V-fold PLP-dependent enzyme [Deltaproteobacteria bacterium]
MTETPKRVVSNLEYLKKLFIMPDSPDKFVEFGHELLEIIHDFFQEKGGIHSSISLPELSKIFDQITIPDSPLLIKDVLSEIKSKVIKHSVKVYNPYYIGHMTSAIPYFMILLEMIIAALNQNQVKIETAKASSFVEKELITWLHHLIFRRKDIFYENHTQDPRVALGSVTSGGTLANLTALLVAREKAFPPRGGFQGVRTNGMAEALNHYGYKRGVIIVSSRGHYSIRKAVNLLGIGDANVISIPVDDHNHIDINKVRRKVKILQEDEEIKTKIITIVGIAGTTETGNVDNLEALGEIARNANTHFHVDACWGGPALLADDYRHLFKGIELANSVSIDTHKLFFCPMSMGLILFRNEKDLNLIKHASQYIIRKNSVDIGRFTIEGSRPFASLKPWASLKIIGRQGYGLLFREARESTDYMRSILDHCGNFETLNIPELFILNYRFIPETVRDQLAIWKKDISSSEDKDIKKIAAKKTKKSNNLINGLNIKLHRALRMDDTTFVSRTTLESTRYRPQNIVVLRAVLINPLTNREILNEIVETQNRIGLSIWKKFKSAFIKICNNTT